MLKGNVIIGQSGGPTSVINASLSGIVTKCCEFDAIEHIFGMRYGIEGFMAENIIDLVQDIADAVSAFLAAGYAEHSEIFADQ